MLDRVARENTRARRGVDDRSSRPPTTLGVVWGWPGGLRLAVDNLVRNAVTHGGATRIVLRRARARPTEVTIVVDDNGRGLPAEEHQTVLGRFSRGSTAAPGGSGLGLALVAQQAALHGGIIGLSDGPLGGLRATLTRVHVAAAEPGLVAADRRDGQRPRRRASRAAARRSSSTPPR